MAQAALLVHSAKDLEALGKHGDNIIGLGTDWYYLYGVTAAWAVDCIARTQATAVVELDSEEPFRFFFKGVACDARGLAAEEIFAEPFAALAAGRSAVERQRVDALRGLAHAAVDRLGAFADLARAPLPVQAYMVEDVGDVLATVGLFVDGLMQQRQEAIEDVLAVAEGCGVELTDPSDVFASLAEVADHLERQELE